MAYRVYITDTLYYRGQNKAVGVRYEDIIKPKPSIDIDGDEIAKEVIERLNLRTD